MIKNLDKILFVIVIVCLTSTVVSFYSYKKVKSENIKLIAQIKNPAVVKEPTIIIKKVKEYINLSEEEKKQLVDKYNTRLEELNEMMNNFQRETIEISREGGETITPVSDSKTKVIYNNIRLGIDYSSDRVVGLNIEKRIYKSLNGKVGVNSNNTAEIGFSIGFGS